MAFSTTCYAKGCGAVQNPYIDPLTNKVYCSQCNAEIFNLSIITKNQMKFSKQFKPKTVKAFAFKCQLCNQEEVPKIINDDVVCGSCNKSLSNLSPIFKNMLKEKLKTIVKDIC